LNPVKNNLLMIISKQGMLNNLMPKLFLRQRIVLRSMNHLKVTFRSLRQRRVLRSMNHLKVTFMSPQLKCLVTFRRSPQLNLLKWRVCSLIKSIQPLMIKQLRAKWRSPIIR